MPDAPLTPSTRPVRRRPRRSAAVAGVAAVALALGSAACSPTSTESPTTSSSEAPSTTGGSGGSTPAAEGSSYGSIADLHQAIVDAGFACTLEYPGLVDDVSNNEVSICTIEDEQAFLTIWPDPATLAEFTSSPDGATGTVAIGADWTISVTSADLAGRLADALGGTAPSGG